MAIAPTTNEDQPVKSKSNGLLYILIGVIFVLLLGGGAAYYFLVMKAGDPSVETVKAKVPEIQVFVPLEIFTVNLVLEPGESQQYLQTMINLQVPSDATAAILKSRMPELRNRILFILTNKKASEITTVDGKNILIAEITEQVQKPFSGSTEEQKVTGVYFSSFIIQ